MKTTHPAFKPPFCPKPECPHHEDPSDWEYVPDGYHRNQALGRNIRRFKCLTCRRSFSTQTFDTTYWLKRPDLLPKVFKASQACAGLRQIADLHGTSHPTVARQLGRLGRHCLLYHQRMRPKGSPSEDLVLDGFVSFEFSQYWPCEFHTLVGAKSHFLHGFTDSPLRRSGRMTEAQKKRRAELEETYGRPDPKTVVRDVEQVPRMAAPEPATIRLRSDEHAAYPRAIEKLEHLEVAHEQTNSKVRRTPKNPLFPINLLHLLIRHRGANHKRETIAQSKRRQGAIERLAVFQVSRNYVKARFVRRPKEESPAEVLGLMDQKLSLPELLKRRLFPTLMELPEVIEDYYYRRIVTAQLPEGRTHQLYYAF